MTHLYSQKLVLIFAQNSGEEKEKNARAALLWITLVHSTDDVEVFVLRMISITKRTFYKLCLFFGLVNLRT